MFEGIRAWFKKFEPKEEVDPYLGRIRNDRYGNWLGCKPFRPLNREVDFLFRCGDEPPDEHAVQFFQQIENEFPRLWTKVGADIFKDLPEWEDGTTMSELFQSLKITDFCFWDLRKTPKEWEMYCTTEKMDSTLFHVNMRELEYFDFSMDT